MNLYTKFLLGGLLALFIAGIFSTFGNFPNDCLIIMMNFVGAIFTFVGLIGTCFYYVDER